MRNIFAAYSDESFHEQYHAIGVVSGRKNLLLNLRKELQNILDDKNIREVKFSEIRTHRPKIEVAKEFLDLGIEFSRKNMIRIDILIWDLKDSRAIQFQIEMIQQIGGICTINYFDVFLSNGIREIGNFILMNNLQLNGIK